MHRQSRIRRALAFTSTLLGAFMILGVAAAIALGSVPNPNANPAAGNMVTICHGAGQSGQKTVTVNTNGQNGHFDNKGNLHQGDTLGACDPGPDGCGGCEGDDDPIDCDDIGGDHETCPDDQCPNLQGYQSSTSSCPAPPPAPDPVDACPNVTGFQQSGPCDTPGSSDTTPPSDPTPTDTTGGGDQGEQVEAADVPEAESLTLDDAPEDLTDPVGDEEIVAGAAAGGGATDAGATVTPTGSLPYTGGPLELVAALGALLVLMGISGIAIGRRADRRRAAAAA